MLQIIYFSFRLSYDRSRVVVGFIRRDLMDIIFEFIFEVVFEGLVALFFYRKVPLWIRILIGIGLAIFYLFIFIGLTSLGVLLVTKKEFLGALFILGIDLFLIIGSIIQIRKRVITHLIAKNTDRLSQAPSKIDK